MQSPPHPSDPPHRKSADNQWTILEILRWTTAYFKSRSIDSPRLTAEILLAHTLKMNRIDLYLRFDQPLVMEERAVFKRYIQRRIQREPVAYITGTREFWGIDFRVTPAVLIPRPETEFLVEAVLDMLPLDPSAPCLRILDVGTGSGAVIIALACHRPGHAYFASDISSTAIALAADNAIKNHVRTDIRFFAGNLFQALDEKMPKFDLIVSNPPYIPTDQIPGLAAEVAVYEPFLALDGGSSGLDILCRIIQAAPRFLHQKGRLLMEIGFDQKDAITRRLADDGRYGEPDYILDYSGHHRVVRVSLK